MTRIDLRTSYVLAGIVCSTFVASLLYNGVGHSLHWLAVASVIVLIWLVAPAIRWKQSSYSTLQGWLPAIVVGYIFWLLLSPYASTYPYVSTAVSFQLALLPLCLLGWIISKSEADSWPVVWFLLMTAGSIVAIWGISDFVVFSTRAHGPLIDANAYAALINLFLIPAAHIYLRTTPSGEVSTGSHRYLGLVALFSLALCMSLSRGGLLSLAVILPVLFWLNRLQPHFRWRSLSLILVLIAAYALAKSVPFGPSNDMEALLVAPGQQAEKDPSIRARFLMWQATWSIIKEANPLFGTGLGTYKSKYAAYRDAREVFSSGNLAHNDYLQALQEGGLVQFTFLLTFTVVIPLLLLYQGERARNTKRADDPSRLSAGLLLGIVAVSLHALVNFTHYVAPIAALTGLYIARSWQTLRAPSEVTQEVTKLHNIKLGVLRGLIIALAAVSIVPLVADGIIFKLFAPHHPLIARLSPNQGLAVVNLALAIRPANPKPRTFLIQHLLNAANKTQSSETRSQLIMQAESEALALVRVAPGLASGRFFLGKARAARGTVDALRHAREDLEQAVKLVPESSGMRVELLRLYQKLGLEEEAYQTVLEAKHWFMHEIDYTALAIFSLEASRVAAMREDKDEMEFWMWVRTHLTQRGLG